MSYEWDDEDLYAEPSVHRVWTTRSRFAAGESVPRSGQVMGDVIGREHRHRWRRRFKKPALPPVGTVIRYLVAAVLCVAAVALVTVLNLRFDTLPALLMSIVGGLVLMFAAAVIGSGL